MNIKKRTVMIFLNLILVFALLATVTFAWFSFFTKTESLQFEVGYMDSVVTLFEGVDFDRDGSLDIDFQTNQEKFLNLGDTTSDVIPLSLKTNSFFPSQIYTWKIEVKNKGNIKGITSMEFDFKADGATAAEDMRPFSIKVNDNKYYFANFTDGIMEIASNIDIEIDQTGTVQFSLCFEKLEDLVAEGISISNEEYQAFKGKAINLPILNVNLESNS